MSEKPLSLDTHTQHPANNSRQTPSRTPLRKRRDSPPRSNLNTNAEWLRRCETEALQKAQKLGVDRSRLALGRIGASEALSVLGPEWFAGVTAVNVPGKVIWCNFDLARELGFDVPPSNRMTQDFHERLTGALSYRILERKEAIGDRKTVTIYADKYSGDGVVPALGAGRAGFLPYGNLYIKGIGITPLFKHDDPDDFTHSHGGLALKESLAEAIWGEVNANLFSEGSAQVLAIIDHGKYVVSATNRKVRCVLLVRAGAQFRPAHLLARNVKGENTRLDLFIRITRHTGQIVTRQNLATGAETIDVKATMLRIIDDHARTAAEQFRWRAIHGALSPSNMQMSGAMIDTSTQTSQPRTAPVWILPFPESVYGREQVERAIQLGSVYKALLRSIPKRQREPINACPIDLLREMERAYSRCLEVEALCSTGIKREVAERLRAQSPGLASRFTENVKKMIDLKNPGKVNAGDTLAESVSVLDVFSLLQVFPAIYFNDPCADHADEIHAALKPIYRGNRFHAAKKQSAVAALIKEFGAIYHEIMSACKFFAEEYYGDAAAMQRSIKARAAFENEPLSSLYYVRLSNLLNKATASYNARGDATIFREVIDKRISESLRNVDALIHQGRSRPMPDGGMELEMRAIDGINYSVRAWNDYHQTRRLHVSLPVEREGKHYVTALPDQPPLTERQVQSLYYRFTIDAGASWDEVPARLIKGESRCMIIDFEDICPRPLFGRLEGKFILRESEDLSLSDDDQLFSGYTFAMPDKRELAKLTGSSRFK